MIDTSIVRDAQVIPLEIPYTPHAGQYLFDCSPARFRIVVCGRKWGKTTMLIWEAFKWMGVPGALVWWVAPQHNLNNIAWKRILKEWLPLHIQLDNGLKIPLIRRVLVKEKTIEFQNGATMEFKTAANPQSLLGEGVDFMIIDEASRVKRDVWESDLRPNLSDSAHAGFACMASTPQGLNWYHDEWKKGLKGYKYDYDEEYESWYVPMPEIPVLQKKMPQLYPGGFPTWTNPHWYDMKSAISQAQRAEPVFLQELAARFIEDISFVFKGTGKVVDPDLKFQDPRPSGKYFVGADIAKTNDYFCAVVVNQNLDVCNMIRYNGRSYKYQVKDMVDLAVEYNNARILMDQTGIGDPVYEMAREYYKRVEGVNLTNQKKQHIVDQTAIMVATKKTRIPEDDAQKLVEEMRYYGSSKTASGNVRYSAPRGKNDDCVIAYCMAVYNALGMGKKRGIGFRWLDRNWNIL